MYSDEIWPSAFGCNCSRGLEQTEFNVTLEQGNFTCLSESPPPTTSARDLAVGIGVGVTLALVLLLVALVAHFVWRRKDGRKKSNG